MVTLKHKVTIRRKTPQKDTLEPTGPVDTTPNSPKPGSTPPSEPDQPVSSPPQSGNQSKSKSWIAGLVIVAAIIAGGCYFINRENTDSKDNATTETVSQRTEKQVGDEKVSATDTASGNAGSQEGTSTNGSATSNPVDAGQVSGTSEKISVSEVSQNSKDGAKSSAKKVTSETESANSSSSKTSTSLPVNPSTHASASVTGSVKENARRVIRGDFGNGQERKDRLGESYSPIQHKVNEMYRQGLVR